MKTSLHFEAPPDLSVGTVRISGHGGTVAEWVATPDDRIFRTDDIVPGSYLVEISPAGVASQSVFFEVMEGESNTVALPRFSALASTGSNTAFLSDSSGAFTEFATRLAAAPLETAIKVEKVALGETGKLEERRLSVGLSQEQPNAPNSFGPFRRRALAEMIGGRLEIELDGDNSLPFWRFDRVRLSIAIEKSRVERALVPMYRGGTTISVTSSMLSTSDVTLEIVPADPMLRALVRALDAGTSDEAIAVQERVFPKLGMTDFDSPFEGDPWIGILVSLLSIRFPEVIGAVGATWLSTLAECASWAFDTHVIVAHRAVKNAGETERDREAAIEDAVKSLAKAQTTGSPYYVYSDELFSELICGLNELRVGGRIRRSKTQNAIERIFKRYQRETGLQKKSGATFVWFRRDQEALAAGLLIPDRNSTGLLRRHDTTVIFEGRVASGKVTLGNGMGRIKTSRRRNLDREASWSHDGSFANCPALQRPPGPKYDPNKGRFGGCASAGGFTITASFAPTDDEDWVKINFVLETEKNVSIDLGESAWFFLHPTFSPPQLKVFFRGRRASLSTEAYGGFTLGIWLPKHDVELELNLAKLLYAPTIIQTR